jgi:hypothetical protein
VLRAFRSKSLTAKDAKNIRQGREEIIDASDDGGFRARFSLRSLRPLFANFAVTVAGRFFLGLPKKFLSLLSLINTKGGVE